MSACECLAPRRTSVRRLDPRCVSFVCARSMMIIVNFILAALGMMLFEKNDPAHFGTLIRAMMSIWQIETLDSWEEILYINMLGCAEYAYDMKLPSDESHEGFTESKERKFKTPWVPFDGMAMPCNETKGMGWVAVLYFVFVIMLGAMVLPTLLIGVISLSFDETTKKMRDEKKEQVKTEKIMQFASRWENDNKWVDHFITMHQMDELRILFQEINFDGDGGVCEQELLPFLELVCTLFLKEIPLDKLKTSECGSRAQCTRGFSHAVPLSHPRAVFMIADRDQSGDMGWSEFLWFVTFLKCEYLQSLGRMKKFRFEGKQTTPPPAVKEEEVQVTSESLAVSVDVPRVVPRDDASKPVEAPKIADFNLTFGLFCSHGDESKESPDDLSRALDSLDVLARTPRERMEVELAQVKERLAQLQSRKGELEAAMGSGPDV